jgi:hypothetical protein
MDTLGGKSINIHPSWFVSAARAGTEIEVTRLWSGLGEAVQTAVPAEDYIG